MRIICPNSCLWKTEIKLQFKHSQPGLYLAVKLSSSLCIFGQENVGSLPACQKSSALRLNLAHVALFVTTILIYRKKWTLKVFPSKTLLFLFFKYFVLLNKPDWKYICCDVLFHIWERYCQSWAWWMQNPPPPSVQTAASISSTVTCQLQAINLFQHSVVHIKILVM